MPPIHPDSLAPSDQSAAISCSAAAKVICAARFATKPNDSKAVALADPPRTRDGSSNARVSAMSHLIARGCMPSQVASGIAMCSPESDSVPEQQTDVVEGRVLDHAECEQARVGRDPAYDGRFFTGVRTTGIYCRPVCPVRPAHARNVTFFPSAAAAEAAGFRPSLRCRPETAPFCPAWRGSRAIVDRAARLIAEEGALDGEGASVEFLAERVGVGARHLARLFARHLGAPPSQVARTARVQRAKRLLDETDSLMTEIAVVAGFGSVRRFNTVFAEVYGREPTEIRRTRSKGVPLAQNR